MYCCIYAQIILMFTCIIFQMIGSAKTGVSAQWLEVRFHAIKTNLHEYTISQVKWLLLLSKMS